MVPSVVVAEKLGATSPNRNAIYGVLFEMDKNGSGDSYFLKRQSQAQLWFYAPLEAQAWDELGGPDCHIIPSPAGRDDRVREIGDGERLQPNTARTGERGEENAVAAEEHVGDSLDTGDLEFHVVFEHAYVPG